MQAKTILAAAACGIALSAAAKTQAPESKKISNELIGIFFEDISSSADGGLYAELVQNGSFEFSPAEHDGWGPGTAWRMMRPGHATGYIEPRTDSPLNDRNPHYMRIVCERATHYYDYKGLAGVGIRNEGFDGINVEAGKSLDFSVFLRVPKGKMPVKVRLTGRRDTVLAEAAIEADGQWKQYKATLTSGTSVPAAQLQIVATEVGELDVDMVSLMPQDTYKGHGLRKDMAEALAALHPKFVRFPGGCVVHGGGDGFWATYHWKNTVGPKEQRIGTKNPWGYHQSMGLGYYEYFQWCEDMGAQPLPILPVGVSCQGAGGGWGMRGQAQTVKPMSEMDQWAQDALDLIEWANGDASTKWGAVRAAAGHPKPFGLKYLGLGNEEKITPEFRERFEYIFNKIKAKHPEIVVVGTAGPGSHKGNPDYDNGWKIAEQTGLPIIDEHYYERREYFYDNQANYDKYPRDRKTKVYLGEYAAKDKKMADALAEGLYLTGIERNGDVVVMTSYAPLLAKKNHLSWNPDLIYFDNQRIYLTASYYVQQMFGQSSGDTYYAGVAKFGRTDKMLGTSCVKNTKKGELYIKVINATGKAETADIDLSSFRIAGKTAAVSTLAAESADAENNFDAQPIKPVASTLKAAKKMTVEAKPYSCTMLTLKVK